MTFNKDKPNVIVETYRCL